MGMAKYLQQWIDDPTTPGERVLFKKPNWTDKEEALAERRRHGLKEMKETRDFIGKELLKEWQEEVKAQNEKAEAEAQTTAVAKVLTAEEKLAQYDKLILLRTGIGGWTYCEPKRDAAGDVMFREDGSTIPDRDRPIPVSIEAIQDLEPATADWAGLTLVALIESGFRPVMPVVVRDEHENVIDITPGVDSDPLAYSPTSTATWRERTA